MNLRISILALVPLRRADIVERLADGPYEWLVEDEISDMLLTGELIERDGVLHAHAG